MEEAGGVPRKNMKSLTCLEHFLPPIYKRITYFVSGICRDCAYLGQHPIFSKKKWRSDRGKCV
jgi:hypothetical protein